MDGLSISHFAQVLATDLDGTFIPLEGNEQNRRDLKTISQELKRQKLQLVFVTGRHLDSVLQAISHFSLPFPDFIICDVGSSIYLRRAHGGYELIDDYHDHQDEIIAQLPIPELRQQLHSIDGLHLQEEEKQGRFKLSFYVDAERLSELAEKVRKVVEQLGAEYSIIHSVDPFNGDGLIDLLPADVSKAYALDWWSQHARQPRENIVFAGDSGNDYAAFTAGYRAIVVGNAERALAKHVFDCHTASEFRNRLFLAKAPATSGVLEGMRWFGLAETPHSMKAPAEGALGAVCLGHDTTYFRVWAPSRSAVAVQVEGNQGVASHALLAQDDGYYAAVVNHAPPGAKYQFLLDKQIERPDPASRFQPDGVHAASQIVDPNHFPWTDIHWPGIPKRDLIIYELHLGSFTQEGTFRAAIARLPELVDLGVTAIEIMPVAQSPGRWNWGYDGVNLFAPRNSYGEPDDLRAMVDACHALGLAVILDVVYNHFGPEGNYLADFGPYLSKDKRTPWGEALNYDGESSKHVRRYIIANATYWLKEFHVDGLRLDAVHFTLDDSCPSILDDIGRAFAEYQQSTNRQLHLIAETNTYDRELLTSGEHRPAYDAIWSDCLMHSIYSHALPDLQLTRREYHGRDDLAEVLEHGCLYCAQAGQPHRMTSAQHSEFERPHRASFVTALQTHDAVGNHPFGKRLHQLTSKAYQRASAALVLLSPSIPLIFMGEEAAMDAPFPFFADFEDPFLREAVEKGRFSEHPQHEWGEIYSPSDEATFLMTKCHDSAFGDEMMLDWYRNLIALRKRGLAEGWLTVERIEHHSDKDLNVFSLRFRIDNHGQVCVLVRLNHPEEEMAAATKVKLEGTLVLSSEQDACIEDGQIALHANQAVISRS